MVCEHLCLRHAFVWRADWGKGSLEELVFGNCVDCHTTKRVGVEYSVLNVYSSRDVLDVLYVRNKNMEEK